MMARHCHHSAPAAVYGLAIRDGALRCTLIMQHPLKTTLAGRYGGGGFYLSKGIPLRSEVDEPLRFIRNATYTGAKSFWPKKLNRVKQYVPAARGIQDLWNNETPTTIRSDTGHLRSVALTALLQNFGLKGSRWAKKVA